MKIQAIRENSIALFTDFDELNSRGIQVKSLNGQSTADMIRQSFVELGMDADGAIDVETYINGRAVLIFAQICKVADNAAAIFRFDGIERLINAAWALGTHLPSSLIYADGAYFLTIHSFDGVVSADMLSEYGEPEPCSKLRYVYLCEHGKVLCRGNALKTICKTFHRNHSETSFFADSLNASE